MKKRVRKLFSLLLAVVFLFSFEGITVFAAETEVLPTVLPAPDGIVLYDEGSANTSLVAKIATPDELLDIYEKGSTNKVYDSETYTYISDYGEYYLYNTIVQLDWKIDDGDWAYTSDWDTSYYSIGSYCYDYYSGGRVTTSGIGYAYTYGHTGAVAALSEAGGLNETTDGSWSYYRMNTEDHSVSVRARYYFEFYDASYQKTIVLSDWSEVATYGAGSTPSATAAASLSAPVIEDLEIYRYDSYDGYPEARFDLAAENDIQTVLMWPEQFDAEMTYSELYLEVETCLDPNFGAGETVYKKTFYESSILNRKVTYDYLFYNLFYELPTTDYTDAFCWNGETVYVRARWVNERRVSGEWSEIQSPYSQVVSIAGPQIASYDITISHDTYGFDSEAYYTSSFDITEGCKIGYIYCAPLEGCYVETVTVDGTLMYDQSDESTYELLDWYSDYEQFRFLDDANIATKDLTIEITYGGTPTAQYGITTSCGEGGYLYTYSNYVSWSDDSLVVYHGTAPQIYIDPNYGYVIDSVLIDGVENEQAKTDGYYTFPAITDNSHSIAVTFRREAYDIDYWAGSNGTIATDYEWWNGQHGYVKIGDDITFTFAPNADENGNYYEITNVYVDSVVNETAKTTGTYTFTNVQADHDISVYFSSDPVITHDVTASSGENGSISPEGVVHVREGATQTFYFYPDDGYEVDQVFVDGVEITNLATKEYYNIANVTQDHTISVTFKKLPVQYDVTVLVSGHNQDAHTVSPKGVTPVWEGESFSVSFTPFAGYEVEKVLVDGTVVEADGSYSIGAVYADTTIEIFFRVIAYTVTFVDHDGTILKTETVDHGQQATPPADPTREHYVFTGWDTDFSSVTTAVTIRATYKPAEYTVKFIGWDGAILKTEIVTYAADASAPEAPAREGYDFSHWSCDFTCVSTDLEVTAVYTQKEYTVTFVDSDDTVLSTQTVRHGEAAVPPANPTKEGYTFIGWDNTSYGCVTAPMQIRAMYVEGTGVTYTVTARALGQRGTVSPAGVTTVRENGSLVLSFYADALSKIVRIEVDGTQIDLCQTYTFENITANHTIDVYFAPTAVIHIADDDAQQGTASGHYDLIDDEIVYIIDVTPADGWELDGIYINGELADLEIIDGRFVLRDLSADANIDIRYKEIAATEQTGEPVDDGTGSEADPTSPKTGTNFHTALWIALLVLSGGAAIILIAAQKKRNLIG